MPTSNDDPVVVNDKLVLNGAAHTTMEAARESLSTIPEKTDEELYKQNTDTLNPED